MANEEQLREKWGISSRVGCYDVLDPVDELAQFDVDSRVVGQGAPLTPRHQALDLSVTHQGAARVTLTNRGSRFELMRSGEFYTISCGSSSNLLQTHIACISASIHVSGTHHPACDHARVGFVTFLVIHYRHVQALQTGGHVYWCRESEPGVILLQTL